MKVPIALSLSLLALPLLAVSTAAGQSSVDRMLASLAAVRQYKAAAISPDGAHIAWVEALLAKDGSESQNSAIYVSTKGGLPRRVTVGGKTACAEHSPAWSPDSARLAFLSDCGKKDQLELYVVAANAGPVQKLTDLTGFLQSPGWSPDGKTLAVLFTENAPRAAGPLEPMTPDAGVVESAVYEQRLTLVQPEGHGAPAQITPPNMYVYEYDWSPDSQRFVYTAAPGAGDNNWYIAEMYSLAASGGEPHRILTKPTMQLAVPRWSPDGKTIAFIGGLMSDEGATGGDVFTLPSGGGEPRNLTPGRKSSPAWLRWLSSGRLLLTEKADGGSAITLLNPASGETERLWNGDESITAGGDDSSLSIAADGKTCALIRSSWKLAPEVWSGPVGQWRQVTRANQGVQPVWGEVKNMQWSSDGFQVQGWLLYPAHYDSQKHYPMVVSVHGGPASVRRPAWPGTFFDLSVLSAEDYFVLFPNPRGSYGRGEEFTRANVKDFGYGDLRDILAGVDAAIKTNPIDPARVGIGGWSYGGFMTMWAVTQTNRFRAAVSGAGLANFQSYYGENSIDEWMIPYFGASVYDDPAVYAKSSAINFIKNVKTPTLVVVGDRDGECPAPQSYEFWHALKTLGVKTQFVVYPNEGHQFHKPEHRRDLMRRTLAWFNENMR